MRVLDLGCYPGGWLQIALEKVGPKGIVIGVDLREVEPVKEKGAAAVLIKGDILAEKTQHEIMEHSGGKVNLGFDTLAFENGVYTIQPLNNLAPGVYCVVLGGPLMMPTDVSWWCFNVAQ